MVICGVGLWLVPLSTGSAIYLWNTQFIPFNPWNSHRGQKVIGLKCIFIHCSWFDMHYIQDMNILRSARNVRKLISIPARVNWKKKFVFGFFRICCRPGNWCRCSSIRFSISISTSLWNEKISLQFNLSPFPHLLLLALLLLAILLLLLLGLLIVSSLWNEKTRVQFDLSSSFEGGLAGKIASSQWHLEEETGAGGIFWVCTKSIKSLPRRCQICAATAFGCAHQWFLFCNLAQTFIVL